MNRALLFLIVLIFSVWLGLKMMVEPGYVMFTYRQWVIQMPLWFFLICNLVIVFCIYILLRSLALLQRSLTFLKNWPNQIKKRRSEKLTSQGLIEFTEGDWANAEKHLIKAVNQNNQPLINYLVAARAAQEQEAVNRRDDYLREAERSTPSAIFAIELSQAQLMINGGQWEQAIATLKRLHTLAPNHTFVLKLLQETYQRLLDWNSLHELLPSLKKNRVLSYKQFTQLEVMVYKGLLNNAAKKETEKALVNIWLSIPKALRKQPILIQCYAHHLIIFKKDNEAEQLLRDALKKEWNDQLVNLYGSAKTTDPEKQLKTAEKWLPQHPNNAMLLLALGRISRRNKLWGKAKTYLKNSLECSPNPTTYAEFADLLSQLGEEDAAFEHYRSGLLNVTSS